MNLFRIRLAWISLLFLWSCRSAGQGTPTSTTELSTHPSTSTVALLRFLPWGEIGEHLGKRPLLLGKRPPQGYKGDDVLRIPPVLKWLDNDRIGWRSTDGKFGVSGTDGLSWVTGNGPAKRRLLDWTYETVSKKLVTLEEVSPNLVAILVHNDKGDAPIQIDLPSSLHPVQQARFLNPSAQYLARQIDGKWTVFEWDQEQYRVTSLQLPAMEEATSITCIGTKVVAWREVAGGLQWIREGDLQETNAIKEWKLATSAVGGRLVGFSGMGQAYCIAENGLLRINAGGESEFLRLPGSIVAAANGDIWTGYLDGALWEIRRESSSDPLAHNIAAELTAPLRTQATGWQLVSVIEGKWTFQGISQELQRNIFWDYDPKGGAFAHTFYTLADQSQVGHTAARAEWMFPENGDICIPVAARDGLHVMRERW